MGRDVSRKRIQGYMILCLSLLCLTGMSAAGCGKKDVEYIADGQERTDLADTLEEEEDFEIDIWEELYEVEQNDGDTVTVKIRAAVSSGPDTSQVIGIKRATLDENERDRIAGAVLENGVELEEGLYGGNRDGIPYRMKIGENRIVLYPEDWTQVAPEALKNESEVFVAQSSKKGCNNECELSEEDALELACQFLEEIGVSDRSMTWRENLLWIGNDAEQVTETKWKTATNVQDGYIFWFMQTMPQGEELTGLWYDTDIDHFTIEVSNDGIYGDDGFIDKKMHTIVCVNEHGVIAADIRNIYEITSIEENISLLPVETIQGILLEELKEPDDYAAARNRNLLYYDIFQFDYCLLWDETGEQGSYVPIWELRCSSNIDFATVTVNAIDGSIITWEQRGGYVPEDSAVDD